MNDKRLRRLREVLCNVEKARFDMRNWQSGDCGTVYCAVGWGCQDPVLMKDGLHLSAHVRGTGKPSGIPEYLGWMGWGAVERFFDISEHTAEYLFDGHMYKKSVNGAGPMDVVKRLDEVLENGDCEARK